MARSDGGAFKRMLQRLTSDADNLDAVDLTEDAERSGAQRAAECSCGDAVEVQGRLRTVEFCPQDAEASLEAELFDGSEGVTLIWMGRRRIPGIEPGRTLTARGRFAASEGKRVIYNPWYELGAG